MPESEGLPCANTTRHKQKMEKHTTNPRRTRFIERPLDHTVNKNIVTKGKQKSNF
jgi:hypothetical protein